MTNKSLVFKSLVACFFFMFASGVSAEVDVTAGKALFKAKCAKCHNKNMKDDLTGPALGDVQSRWEDQELLYAWIKNAPAVGASGDPYAAAMTAKYTSAMTPFPELKNPEIANILGYIKGAYEGTLPGSENKTEKKSENNVADKGSNNLLYFILFIVLALLALVLTRIVANLNRMAQFKEGAEMAPRQTFFDIITSKGVVGFLIFALVVLGGYTTVNNAINLGRQQGYAPEQPIKFSHKTHAGIQKIDCQYCHDGARRSKHSVIPAANTCINCHSAVEKGSQFGTAEISKIYASIGWDPGKKTYIEDYEDMTEEEIENFYKEWIGSVYTKDNKLTDLDDKGKKLVDAQWAGIKTSLTNENKSKIQGPIEWERIHNLPDHVYFNHAQHVTVGKIECQTCHGKVEEMEIVGQYAPLSMGWCINCHRETEVEGFKNNDYYKDYQKLNEVLKAKGQKTVRVQDIGGLECQKCHY